MVRHGVLPYDSIVEDGLTMMLRYAMNWSLMVDPSGKTGLGGAPAQHHYMPQMHAVSNHIVSMKGLPVHYGLSAHLELIEDTERGGLKFLPKATGKMRTEIPSWFNETYHCFRETDAAKKVKYFLRTAGAGKWDFFKSSMNVLGKFWDDPIPVVFGKEWPGDGSSVGFASLLDRRFGPAKKGGEGKGGESEKKS